MTWTSFFKSRAVKYGTLVGGVILGAGAGISAALAYKLESLCAATANTIIETIGNNVTIAELTAIVRYDGSNFSITLDDITAALPSNLLDLLSDAKEVDPYCVEVPLYVGILLSTLFAVTLAISVGNCIANQKNAGDDPERERLLVNA